MDSQLEFLRQEIDQYKTQLETYESRNRSGLYVDEDQYEQTRQRHNSLVRQHNSLLAERNAAYAQYEREIDSVNELVRRYNAGER